MSACRCNIHQPEEKTATPEITWVINSSYCLTANEQFVSCITARTSYIRCNDDDVCFDVIQHLIWNLIVQEDDSLVKPFCRDDNKRWIFIKYCVDYYYTYFVPKCCYSDNRNLLTVMEAGGLAP